MTRDTSQDFEETIEKYLSFNKIYRFEGAQGVRNLEKLLGDMGYRNGEFFNRVLENFFADNSGAIEAVIDWISNLNSTEWNENLSACLPEDDAEPEEE